MNRCPNRAAYGITTYDYTENACPEHALATVDRLAPPGKSVGVYQIQSTAPCETKTVKAQ